MDNARAPPLGEQGLQQLGEQVGGQGVHREDVLVATGAARLLRQRPRLLEAAQVGRVEARLDAGRSASSQLLQQRG
eukprot:CAMPEP_0204513750 /NCGR_PEP_ID=MMETSP0661-20131031/1674_1 /ASSEMBLY_ACC=CAM_ASM_000606 /TAXON_ID=109239 /ORGANISM="Alexandrium margalefi, Strain AMGDE01CS-322" /LENGTH=75 /DNA_ID=CAMNT_0051518939 /DNA_START=98 /DNA_END=322 /DNA_ORIENTATION=-